MKEGDKVWRVYIPNYINYTITEEEVDKIFTDNVFTLVNRNSAYRTTDLMFLFREKIFLNKVDAEYWVAKKLLLDKIEENIKLFNVVKLKKLNEYIKKIT